MLDNINLAVLFVTYGNKYPNSKKNILKYLSNINCKYSFIILDNLKLEIIDKKNIEKCNNLNDFWEFGAWELGIKYLNKNNIKYDAILFVNDSFENPGCGKISDIISDKSILKCISKKVNINAITTGAEINNFKINNKYIYPSFRSHCFILPKEMIDFINICPYKYDFLDLCIDKDPQEIYFKKNAPINIDLQEHLVKVIGSTWHSAININKNWDIFRMKSLAFLNEFGVSNQLKEINNGIFSKIFSNDTVYIQIEDFLIDNKFTNDNNIYYMIGREFVHNRQFLHNLGKDYKLIDIYKNNNLDFNNIKKEIKLKENIYFINENQKKLIQFIESLKKNIIFVSINPENIKIYKKIFKNNYDNKIIGINKFLKIKNNKKNMIISKEDFKIELDYNNIYFKIGFNYFGAIFNYLKCNNKNYKNKIKKFINNEKYNYNHTIMLLEILKNKKVIDGALDFCKYIKYMNVTNFLNLGKYKINQLLYYCNSNEAIVLGNLEIDGKKIGYPDFIFLEKQKESSINKNIFELNVKNECFKLTRGKYEQ